MTYEKQNFIDGQVLTAEHLNHIEDGIAAVAEAADRDAIVDAVIAALPDASEVSY